MEVDATRLIDGPIVYPGLSPAIGTNINGPSLIRIPAWVAEPLARYYLYFADHKGSQICLAVADALAGPWRVYEPGVLQLRDTPFLQKPPPAPEGVDAAALGSPRAPGVPSVLADCTTPHIASPEVVIDESAQQIRLYYHGLEAFASQVTRLALSHDGLRFVAREAVLTPSYLRVFRHRQFWYGMAMPGVFFRSRDGLSDFERGPQLFEANMRHTALCLRGDLLWIFWTRVGDSPERILLSTVSVADDSQTWRQSEPTEVLRPERPWEGASQLVEPSVRGAVDHPVCQLRDPALLVEGDSVHLAYAVAGESGVGIACLQLND